jgi:hypothetical protein
MIEHIKKFQEEFKAKYGVEAMVQIKVHDERREEEARKLVSDFADQLGENVKESSNDGVHWFDTGKRWGEIELTAFYEKEKKEETESATEPVGDTMAWK